METQHNTIGALSEIERLGQAVLNAIWAEEEHHHARHDEIFKLLNAADGDPTVDSKDVMEQVREIIGADSISDVVRYALEDYKRGNDRVQAINQYTSARRLLVQAGVTL